MPASAARTSSDAWLSVELAMMTASACSKIMSIDDGEAMAKVCGEIFRTTIDDIGNEDGMNLGQGVEDTEVRGSDPPRANQPELHLPPAAPSE